MLEPAQHEEWIRIARRYARPGIDAADVLQEACIAAMKAGRTNLATPADARYFRGIIRKTAWAMIRADTRRKRHEQLTPPALESGEPVETTAAPDLSALPASLQAVANLVLANLDRREICAALKISDDALRRRLADLRRHLDKHALTFDSFANAVRESAELAPDDLGLIRRALLNWLKSRSGAPAIGTVDPDGHLLVLSEKNRKSLTESDRPATDG